MENQLVKIDPKEYGLEENKAADISAQFKPMLDKMVELEKEYNEVIKLPIEDPKTAVTAKSLRLKYVKVRTGTAEIHKAQKAFYLAGGRFVDGWKNAQLFASEGIEKKLEEIENYAANLEKERIAKLQLERENELSVYEVENVEMLQLGLMTDAVWSNFLAGTKANHEAKLKAEADRIEAERLIAEQKEKERIAYEAEQERIRKENEALKAEAERKEKELQKERDEAAKKLADEQAKAKAEADKIRAENEAKLLEEKKRADKLAADLKAKEDAEKEAKLLAEEAEKKRIADEKKLAKAPDKEKLQKWVNSFYIAGIPTGLTNESGTLGLEISNKFDAFKTWAIKQIEAL